MRVVKTLVLAAAIVAVTAGSATASASGGGGMGADEHAAVRHPGGGRVLLRGQGRHRPGPRVDAHAATYPDGSPKVQDFAGVLVIRYTNTSNNQTVVRDATGTIRVYNLADAPGSRNCTATTPCRSGRRTPASPAATTSPTATSS